MHEGDPLGATYRVSGARLRRSPVLELEGAPGQPGSLVASEGGSTTGLVAGVVLTSAGGAAILTGLVVWLGSALCGTGDGPASSSNCASSTAETVGLAVAGVGVAAVVGGALTLAFNPHSSLKQTLVQPVANTSSPRTESRARSTLRREPERDRVGAPAVIAFPILDRRF